MTIQRELLDALLKEDEPPPGYPGRRSMTTMATLQKKSFSTPDEVRTPPKTRLELVTYNGMSVVRVTYQPGWKWSEHIKPVVGTESCQIPHLAYVLSGTLAVQMEDGDMLEVSSGDLAIVPAGHDAWVVGDEPWMALDFYGASRGL